MMFNGRGGFGQPGTRRFVDTASEVMIPVKQAGVATVAAFVVVVVIYAATVTVCERVCGVKPACHATANAFLWWWRRILFWLALLAPSVAVFTSMLINVYDQSWSPDRKPQAAEDGPNAPGWLRRAIGWRGRAVVAEAQEFNAPTAQVSDRTIHGSIMINSADGHQHWPWNFVLRESDFERLRWYFDRCRRRNVQEYVSVRDLQPVFGKGGNDRRVAKQLRSKGVIREEAGRVIATAEFVEWVLARKYAQDIE